MVKVPDRPLTWARDADTFIGHRRTVPGEHAPPLVATVDTTAPDSARDDFGVTWRPFDVGLIQPSGPDRARHRFRALLPELVWNTAALEGNTFTLPEVRTLLDGVTVGGRRLEDERQILALSEAYSRLDEMVGAQTFSLDKAVSDELHGVLARHEALESGHFRGEGRVRGGGSVSLSNGGTVPGTDPGAGGEDLRRLHRKLLDGLADLPDARVRALIYFASATRTQYYFDGNKRTARLLMAGELMSHGFDPISIPYARRLEFNVALDELFSDDDASSLLAFLATCVMTE